MNVNSILKELRAERDRIDRAIVTIEGLNSTGRRKQGRPPRTATTSRRRGRMSVAARKRLSQLLKQRWAQGKMKPRAAKPAAVSTPRVSNAARRRIAAAQRARWAKVKVEKQARAA